MRKKLLVMLVSMLVSSVAYATLYPLFGPSTGVLKGSATSPQTSAAASADIIALWGGTCSAGTFLRGDGTCASVSGAGTVTSVSLTMPTGFSVSGSPVTASGTLAVTTALSGVLKSSSGAFTTAAAADVYGLWSGTCSSSTFLRGDGSCQTPSGAGNVNTTGTPASGNLTQFSAATTITNGNLSGDCTTSGTLAVTCTKTNGVAFATSATTDTTNASNISSGTLAAGRMPALTGDCTTVAGAVATTCTKTSGVAFAASATTNTTNASNITSGLLGVAEGGSGVGTLTGPIKGNGTSAFSAALAADIVGLFSACSGTQYLGADGACHSGAGNVTTTGSPASGNLARFTGTNSISNGDLSGDCTTSGALTVTCLKTNGTSFGTFATANSATPPAIGGTTPAAGTFTNLTVTPTAGTGLLVTGIASASTPAAKITSAGSTGTSPGLLINGGSNANDYALKMNANVGGYAIGQFLGNGAFNIGWSTAAASPFWIMQGSATGNVTINPPGSGTGLTNLGSAVFGSPTGGDQGVGTLNAQGLYINGIAVSTGAPSPILCTTACSASGIIAGQTAHIAKTAVTNRASTTSVTLDPDLQFTSVPNGTYRLKWELLFSDAASGGGGIQASWGGTATPSNTFLTVNCSGYTSVCGGDGTTASGAIGNTGHSYVVVTGANIANAPAVNGVHAEGIVVITSSGSVGVQWAQNSTSTTQTSVAFSYGELTRIN